MTPLYLTDHHVNRQRIKNQRGCKQATTHAVLTVALDLSNSDTYISKWSKIGDNWWTVKAYTFVYFPSWRHVVKLANVANNFSAREVNWT